MIVSVNGYTLAANVEAGLVATASGLTLTGNGLDNTLFGNMGNDTLYGGIGNDFLIGGQGADTMVGGTAMTSTMSTTWVTSSSKMPAKALTWCSSPSAVTAWRRM